MQPREDVLVEDGAEARKPAVLATATADFVASL
jgi:hypothetical protein